MSMYSIAQLPPEYVFKKGSAKAMLGQRGFPESYKQALWLQGPGTNFLGVKNFLCLVGSKQTNPKKLLGPFLVVKIIVLKIALELHALMLCIVLELKHQFSQQYNSTKRKKRLRMTNT